MTTTHHFNEFKQTHSEKPQHNNVQLEIESKKTIPSLNYKKSNPYPRKSNLKKIDGVFHQITSHKSEKQTLLASDYSSLVTPQGNHIWAGAANLAFKDFQSQFLNGNDLQFRSASNEVQRLLYPLNNSIFTKDNISQNSVYIKSGIGKQGVQTINRQVYAKFPFKTSPPLSEDVNADDFISYAYLMKGLVYEHPFQRQPGILWFGKALNQKPDQDPYMVEAFAATTPESLQQIKVIQFNGRHNFFIGFKTKLLDQSLIDAHFQKEQQKFTNDKIGFWQRFLKWVSSLKNKQVFNQDNNPDVIYLLSANEDPSVNETIESIIDRVQAAQNQHKIDDRPSNPNLIQFQMPVIDLDLKHQYDEFRGQQIANDGKLQGKKLRMVENLKLRMDEKGVIVQNDAFICKDECAIMGSIQINIQNPFWIVLTEQGKHPYLVAKINYLPEKKFIKGQNRDFFIR